MGLASDFIKTFLESGAKGTLTVPRYRRADRTLHRDAIAINGAEILIVEGVPALFLPNISEVRTSKVFVKIDEGKRKDIFLSEYNLRGYSSQSAEDLYRVRGQDEHAVIMKSETDAQIVVDFSHDY